MTEEKGVAVNEDTIQVFSKALLDYYNYVLTGLGFEELITRAVVLKETGFIGSTFQFTDILIALTMFHANALVDIEQKAGLPADKVADMRRRSVNAFEASLTYNAPDAGDSFSGTIE